MSFPLEGAGMLWIWIQLLYRDPTARVQVNSFLSAPFSLHRETRQVCPLSPGFFCLDLDQRVGGLQIGVIQEKISLYADNTLLYLADSRVSLQSALEIIDQFGGYSGICINWHKLVLFSLHPLGSGSVTDTQLQWVEEFKY